MNKAAKSYLATISFIGTLIVLWAVWQLQYVGDLMLFFALFVVGLIVQITATVNKEASTTFSVNQAVNLAVLMILGTPAAIVVAVTSTAFSWVFNTYVGRKGWKGSFNQLAFNSGMIAIVLMMTGMTHQLLIAVGVSAESSLFLQIASWCLIAVVNDQMNLALVAGIVYLQQGIHPYAFWQEHKWLMPMNMVITIFGSNLLASAVANMSLAGIGLFCLPMLLTSYSLRLYIKKSEQQINDLRLREEQLKESNEQLNTLDRAKDRFLAVLSHDMRTTLTSIRLYSQMLSERGHLLPDEKKQKMLQAIMISERTLADMVDNLLDIEQLLDHENCVTPLNWMRFDLAIAVARVATTMEIQLMTKNLNLITKVHEEQLWVEGDQSSLKKVITNLISNAIKYTPNGGTITLELYATDEHICMSVSDTGYGMSSEVIESIFEPYYRIPEHVNYALGTGLGLSIVKHLIEQHNGVITVTSEENIGSSFTVRLPNNRSNPDAEAAATAEEDIPITKLAVGTLVAAARLA